MDIGADIIDYVTGNGATTHITREFGAYVVRCTCGYSYVVGWSVDQSAHTMRAHMDGHMAFVLTDDAVWRWLHDGT